MPTAIPTAAIQNGMVGGSIMGYRMQVTNIPSVTSSSLATAKINSIMMPTVYERMTSARLLQPKKYIDATTVGAAAAITTDM